jgi:hypothetical protein
LEPGKFEAAIARLPRWLLGLAVVGTIIAASVRGLSAAGGFLIGALAAWFNLRLVERTVDRIARDAAGNPGKKRRAGVLLKFGALLLGAFVIIRYSGFSMAAALTGFFVCPAAVIVEIVYELMNYDA